MLPHRHERAYNIKALKKTEIKRKFVRDVIDTPAVNTILRSSEFLWKSMKNNILTAADKHISKENRRKLKEHWMTPEIRELFKERRLAKGDPDRYRKIQNTIQRECKKSQGNMVRIQMPRTRKPAKSQRQRNVQPNSRDNREENNETLILYKILHRRRPF